MNNTEDQKLLAELIKRAESGDHTKFDYIRSWAEYRSRQINKRATKMLVNSLEHSAASLLKTYCKDITKGTADVTKLFARNILLRAAEFYKLEFAVIEDMISEYEAYLFDGNILEQFIFYESRPFAECWDRRSMK